MRNDDSDASVYCGVQGTRGQANGGRPEHHRGAQGVQDERPDRAQLALGLGRRPLRRRRRSSRYVGRNGTLKSGCGEFPAQAGE